MKYPIVNVPNVGIDDEARVVGVRITEGDEVWGKFGLSEPCNWLRKVFEDAARYQWIKSQSELSSYEDSYALPIVHAWDYKPGPELNEQFESLDEAIDKAIEIENEKEI